MSNPLITASQVRQHLGGISNVTLWRWERDGVITKAVRLNGRKYWLRSEIEKLKASS